MNQKQTKKTVMNYSLAKALMDAGMEHFDVGGVVAAPSATSGISNGISQGVQGALSPVTGVLNGLAGATTVQNQYNAQLAPTDYTNYGNQINQGTNQLVAGYEQAQQDRKNQLMLQDILMQRAQGEGGPSVAEAALNKATGNNINAQAALMAGTRGGGANVGLLAKQAAQQGGALQQQAASDAAILRAQEQLSATGQLQNQQNLIGNQNLGQQGVSGNLLATGANSQNQQNRNTIENYGMAQGINAKTAQLNAQAVNDRQGGLLKSVPVIGGLFGGKYKGGEIPDHFKDMAKIMYPEHFDVGGYVSDYTHYEPPKKEKDDNPDIGKGIFTLLGVLNEGGQVPGKAVNYGDSTKNDTQLGLLSPGEVVLPRSVTKAKNAPSKAAEFMRHLQDKKEKKDYKRVAESKKSLKERVEMLEKYAMGGCVK